MGVIILNNELYHYGVLGMKWGHRKAQPISTERNRYKSSKKAYKQANKEYNKAFNKAYGYSSRHLASQYFRKKNKADEKGFENAQKVFDETVSGLYNKPLSPGVKKVSNQVNINAGDYARRAAADSYNDSFRKAARNVRNYRKANGDLKGLASTDFWSRAGNLSIDFEKRRR